MANIEFEIKIDYGARPFQTFKELFKFRNIIAHGKLLIRKKTTRQQLANDEQPQAVKWDKWWAEYTVEKAKRWKKDTKTVAQILQYAYERPEFDEEDVEIYDDYKKLKPFTLMGSSHTIKPSQ